MVFLFVIGTTGAQLLGVWKNEITTGEYLYHVKNLDHPVYRHKRGELPDYKNDLNSQNPEDNVLKDHYRSSEGQ